VLEISSDFTGRSPKALGLSDQSLAQLSIQHFFKTQLDNHDCNIWPPPHIKNSAFGAILGSNRVILFLLHLYV
jgi:hypothetical protein